MKILMLGWELPPHNSGGLGVACYQMCKQLALQGVAIDFVLPYTATHDTSFMTVKSATRQSPAELLTQGGAYANLGTGGQDLRAQQQRYIRYVKKIVKQTAPDVIHAHDWLTFEAGMAAKKITGKPLIAHVHATEYDRSGEHFGDPLVHDIEYTGLLMADKIIAVSQITKNIITKNYGIPADKIEVVHNGIDPAAFGELRADNSYVYLSEMKKRGYKVVVSVGRLTVQKGLRYLLQAAHQALEVNEKLLFLIVGAGELRNELISQAADLGIADSVLFAGFVRGKQWRDAYEIADIFVMSSVSEPFGMTALEAAGCNNTIVITRQSGAGEVLKNVLRYDFWDTNALASQLVDLAEFPSLQSELTKNVQHEFSTLSWVKAAKQFQQLYKGATAKVAS